MDLRILRGAAITAAAVTMAQADWKATTTYHSGEARQSAASSITLMEKGDWRRTETGTPSPYVMIDRPDRNETIMLDTAAKTFRRMARQTGGDAAAAEVPASATGERRTGAVVKMSVHVEDTGERRQMFGRAARRLKMTTMIEAPQNACNPGTMKMETDGWYIDWPTEAARQAQEKAMARGGAVGCRDEYRMMQSGSGKTGYPLYYHAKTWINDGAPSEMTMEVKDLSFAELDAALFDVPAGYSEQAVATASGVRVAVAPVGNGSPAAASRIAATLSGSGVSAVAVPANSVDAAKAAGAEYLLSVETAEVAKKKSGGMFGKLAKSISGEESKADYKLVAVKDGSVKAVSSVSVRQGGVGAGTGMLMAAGVATSVAGAAGATSGSYVANTVAHTMQGEMMRAAYRNPSMGGMDPALNQMMYMSAYSPRYAAMQGLGMMAGRAVAQSAAPGAEPASVGNADGLLDGVAKAVVDAVGR